MIMLTSTLTLKQLSYDTFIQQESMFSLSVTDLPLTFVYMLIVKPSTNKYWLIDGKSLKSACQHIKIFNFHYLYVFYF